MKQLSIDEKLEIRNKAKAEIDRISNIENSEKFVENMKKIEIFKNKFLKCERAYRKLHFFSAKDIRNNLSHAFEQKYIDELIHRYTELNKDMDIFLNTILEFDDVA